MQDDRIDQLGPGYAADAWNEYHGTQEIMNGALAEVLDALGYERWPFGVGGAWIVTGRRAGRLGAGR
ncbi:MAG: hypothetical protein ACLQDY_18820 [Streptosporangiaceae bacterium]